MNENDVYVVHSRPAIIERRNYIANVDLAPYGLSGQFEQLWLRPVDGGQYEVACIPFCVYGLALLDQVTVTADGRFVNTIVSRSGRRVLRILLMESLGVRLDDVISVIRSELDRLKMAYEWQGERHIAIDVSSTSDLSRIFEVVGPLVDVGDAHWEWGDAFEYVPPNSP